MSHNLFGWFQKSKHLDSSSGVEELFLFLKGYINREDLIDTIWLQYLRVPHLPADEQEAAYVSVYTKLEDFIVTNNPLIVVRRITRDQLRADIREKVKVDRLPSLLQLVFLPEKDRIMRFFHYIASDLIREIISVSGEQRLGEIGDPVLKKCGVSGLRLNTDGISYETALETSPVGEIRAALRDLYQCLYSEIFSVVGQATAISIVTRLYERIAKTQNTEILTDFFFYVPEDILISERLSYLSKEELTKRVSEATGEEKKKKEEAQTLAGQLSVKVKELENQSRTTEETKRAMLNLLEDARELETTLKTERDRITAIVSSMGEGLYVVDTSYHITMVNNVAATMLGLSREEAVGKNLTAVTKLYHNGKEFSKEERPLMRTLTTGESIVMTMEDDVEVETGKTRFPVALVTVPLKKDGMVIGALVTFHDVSRDKRMKETIEAEVVERTYQLQGEQAKLTASINSLVAGFILTDKEGRIITKNPASETILGISHIVGSLEDIEKELQGAIKLNEQHVRGHTEKKPVRVKDILLGTKHLELFFAPIFLSGGESEFLGTVILVQDVTEAKVLERSRDEFFSIASHELRTPLTAIRGNTSMILEYFSEELKNPEFKELIDDIHESSIRLINIVNDFLQTSRLEQGRLAFNNEAFDVSKLIADVLKEYDVTGSRKKLYLRYVPPDKPLPLAFADRDRVKEVLINLVGNGLKFTEVGGVTVKIYLHDGWIRVVVEDTGRGIAYENQMFLFHKFQQAGDSLFTRDTTKGTGLGLYISKLMVEGMHGTIGLQYSRPGVGSAFGFALPIAGGEHATSRAKQPVAPET